MVKLMGGLLLVLCSSLIGFSAGQILFDRLEFCHTLCSYLECMKSELQYNCAPLDQIAQTLAGLPSFSHYPFALACKEVHEAEPFGPVFYQAACDYRRLFGEEVFAFLQQLSNQLGNFPLETQLLAIEHCQRQTEDYIEANRIPFAQKRKLYRTLSFWGGMAAAIIIW